MRFGFIVPNFGAFGDVRGVTDLARAAEDSGWDAFFTWDHIDFENMEPNADPWILMTSIVLATETIRVGPMVTPLPRRHLGKLAREISTLDHLSGGRVIFGAGSGPAETPEATAFGEPAEARARADMVDEGLDVLCQWWGEGPVSVDGTQVSAHIDVTGPTLQQPRVPIWLAATWPNTRPIRRSARWDGVYPITSDVMGGGITSPEDIASIVEYVSSLRTESAPFDVVHARSGLHGGTADDVEVYHQAGATWWVSGTTPSETLDDARRYITAGPPRP